MFEQIPPLLPTGIPSRAHHNQRRYYPHQLLPRQAEASRRVSSLYQNIIFREDNPEEEDIEDEMDTHLERPSDGNFLTWRPTASESQATRSAHEITFLRTRTSIGSRNTQTQDSVDRTYSDTSSIVRLPAFHFNPHTIISLYGLTSAAAASHSKGSRKVNLLVAVLESEGPDAIRIRKGPEAGKEITLLKLVVADGDGGIAKVAAWREVAEQWGGSNRSPCVRRGDIILLENVQASWGPASDSSIVSFSASPNHKPSMTVCYRTLILDTKDHRFRPDLRLAAGEPSVRKVQALAQWFEKIAGLG